MAINIGYLTSSQTLEAQEMYTPPLRGDTDFKIHI